MQSAMSDNPQLDLARKYLELTNRNIFLSGKAGTGKTTFLRSLKGNLHKRYVVLAPTGIAALNAEGQTIHSFLQLSFAPYIPGCRLEQKRFRKSKIDLIRSLDLVIIDEISMVRADVLDQINLVLQRLRPKHRNRPFGGVQLLLIGDLSQLPPVATDSEWEMLSTVYSTPYFFSSLAWQASEFYSINLEHIYRQSDKTFIDLLNCVRENQITQSVTQTLNDRYKRGVLERENEGYVILCTHNRQTKEINERHLSKLETKSYFYECEVEGEFDPKSYPNSECLELKEGAQVMFLKNDYSNSATERQYFNGSIGKIIRLDEENIVVKLENSDTEVQVEPYVWEKYRYDMNKTTKEISQTVVGSFKQYPLRLAWAITVHKSQGLTFDKAIIDAENCFTHGQFYVALSRCRTLEGLILASPFSPQAVITDSKVNDFSLLQSDNQATQESLANDSFEFYFNCIEEIYDYETINRMLLELNKFELGLKKVLKAEIYNSYSLVRQCVSEDVIAVSRRLQSIMRELYHYPERLKERCESARGYFLGKMPLFFSILRVLDSVDLAEVDVEGQAEEAARQLGLEIELKCRLLDYLNRDEFVIKEFLALRNTAVAEGERLEWKHYREHTKQEQTQRLKETSETPSQSNETAFEQNSNKESVNTSAQITYQELELDDLFQRLKTWRAKRAKQEHLPAYCILSQIALTSIVSKRPKTLEEFIGLKGIGNKTLEKYGEELLELVLQED